MVKVMEAEQAVAPRARRIPAEAWVGLSLLGLALSYVARFHLADRVDIPISSLLNGLAARSWLFDRAIQMVSGFHTFKGIAVIALLCGALASCATISGRILLVAGAVGAALAAGVSRSIQVFMPSSPRPKFDDNLVWTPPVGGSDALQAWSSFPSDHAALLFGAAFAVLAVSKPWGIAALAVAAGVGFARIYVGLHYATDIAAGAFLGCAMALSCQLLAARVADAGRVGRLAARHRGVLAAIGFMFAVQAALLFGEPRTIAATIARSLGL